MKPQNHKILVVEDQPREREAMCRMLRGEGYAVSSASSSLEASAMVDSSIELVISDLRLGNENALDFLCQLRLRHSQLPFIVVTAYGDIASAVHAMKMGAIDYLLKPLDPTQLLALIRTKLCLNPCIDNQSGLTGFENMIGNSLSMRTVFSRIKRAASTDCSVLITGETGTGKELVAAALHKHSKRSQHPFVVTNISSLPETLIEAELFGVAKGAYTDATHDRRGLFSVAHQGTLFIDEVGELPLQVQPKLLRVLEGASVVPVGSRQEHRVDVRFVFATHRDLNKMVEAEQFRSDLWHRINVIAIDLPALRDRPTDIPLLFSHFLSEFTQRYGVAHLTATSELVQFAESYDWPGNVRQMKNVIESMVVMRQSNELGLDDLSSLLLEESSAQSISHELRDVEKTAILNALRRFSGNRTSAANSLGISVRTLQRKLKRWGLESGSDDGSHDI
ncbi:MAG: sigma-54 dependent transcriptional regulator [Pirellula sp.]